MFIKITSLTISEYQLLAIFMGMFVAEYGTASKYLGFIFLCHLLNPDVLKKSQEDIDRVIIRDKPSTLNDLSENVFIKFFLVKMPIQTYALNLYCSMSCLKVLALESVKDYVLKINA